jgi:hypothetical protein
MKIQYIVLIVACVFSTCSNTNNEVNKTEGTGLSIAASDDRLIELVKLFSGDVGEEGRKAFEEIRSRPNVVDELLVLSRRLPSNDARQPEIAYVLIKLGHEYETNAAIISSALSKEPRFKGFDADQAASLLIRLIHDGDSSRLPDLLRSADWADGALAELVGDEASDQLLNNTVAFLTVLRAEPQSLRMEIYGLIAGSASLNSDDKRSIQVRLQKIEPKSPVFAVARELRTSPALK